MFTGIVQSIAPVVQITSQQNLTYAVEMPENLAQGISLGASIAVNGVCQTVIGVDEDAVYFDAIAETLRRTNLNKLALGSLVNIERAARWGDEIGGHLLSGHVYGTARVISNSPAEGYHELTVEIDPRWSFYFFEKGFVSLDGVSLTVVRMLPNGRLTVHLIPETLRRTTLGGKREGDWLNVEIDTQTQVVVDTLLRFQCNPLKLSQ